MLYKARRLVITSLALTLLLSFHASATHFNWNSTVDPTWENNANWQPLGFPQSPSDTANFLNGPFVNPVLSSAININSVNFSGGAYTLNLNPASDLELQGSINSNTSTNQKVSLTQAALGFNGIASSANAGVGTGGMSYTAGGSTITFRSISTASNGQFHFTNAVPAVRSAMLFENSSSAGTALITVTPVPGNSTIVQFQDSSNAANANIMGNGMDLIFIDTASAGNSTINLTNSSASFASANNDSSAMVQGSGTDVSISGPNTRLAALKLMFDVNDSVASSLEVSADAQIGFLSTDDLTPITLTARTLTFGDTSNTTLPGPISGPGTLKKVGFGTAILSGVNTYTGGTIVEQGTLQGNTNSLQGNIDVEATVTLQQTLDGSYNGQLTGSGVVNIEGGSTITFTGNSSSFTGTVNVIGSDLKMGLSGLLGGNVNLTNDGIFTLTSSQTLQTLQSDASSLVNLNNFSVTVAPTGTMQINGPITGTGGIFVMDGPGTTILNGANTFSGITRILQGTIIGNTTSLQGRILNNGTATFAQSNDGTFNGQMQGTGIVNILGFGFTNTGDSSGFEGTTNVIGSRFISGPAGSWGGNIVLSQGAAFLSNSNQTLASLQSDASSTIQLNGFVLSLKPSGMDQIFGTIGGTGVLQMNGTGTLILSGKNTFSGLIDVQDGVLQGDTNSFTSDILNNSVVDFNQNFNGTFNHTISGDGVTVINGQGGTGTVTFTQDNTYSGGTVINSGALQISADSNLGAPEGTLSFTNDSALIVTADMVSEREVFIGTPTSNAIATIDTQDNTVELDGDITDFSSVGGGDGTLLKTGDGTLILGGINSYSGGTIIEEGTLIGTTVSLQGDIVDDGVLDFAQAFDGTFSGHISGTGSVRFDGSGTVTLTGVNTYTGGTVIANGTVVGDTRSLHGDIIDNSTLIFNQADNGFFLGHLIGRGVVNITGPGTVTFVEPSFLFRGTTFIHDGHLALNNFLGGNVIVNSNGILSGHGVVGNNLTIGSSGTIAPGINVLHIEGDFVQSPDSTYIVEISSATRHDSSVLDVRGMATIEPGATVSIISTEGHNPLITYQILFAREGLTGTYTNVLIDNPMITPELTYTRTNIFLRTPPKFSLITVNGNQQAVAEQFEADLSTLTDAQKAFVTELLNLPPAAVIRAFDQMSGAQYATLTIAAGISAHQFVRRLYDPLRYLIATNPPFECDNCCGANGMNVDIWGDVSWTRSRFSGTCHSKGFRIEDWGFSIGVQKRATPRWTFGTAISYDKGWLSFDLAGKGTASTVLWGLYTLYRPYGSYFVGDLIFGSTRANVNRTIDLFSSTDRAHGHQDIFQGLAYAEWGKDWRLCSLLVQPFVGMELGYFKGNRIIESGSPQLNLFVQGKLFYTALSSLGLHISTIEENTGFLLGLDLAWLYRMTSTENLMRANLQNFGTKFNVHGFAFRRNSFEVNANISQALTPIWDLYAEFAGRFWYNASSWSLLAGVRAKW